jgi:hypothetical protein
MATAVKRKRKTPAQALCPAPGRETLWDVDYFAAAAATAGTGAAGDEAKVSLMRRIISSMP